MGDRAARFKEIDLTRALRAACKAGVDVRVEIELDGRMIVMAGRGVVPAPGRKNSFD